jgi:mannose-1-phosphate guanylyltransferase/mannose-6-phosphate isomerase
MDSRLIPVLMCGVAGTRLWPRSRESMPKQFTPLVGGRSTFQQVLDLTAVCSISDMSQKAASQRTPDMAQTPS